MKELLVYILLPFLFLIQEAVSNERSPASCTQFLQRSDAENFDHYYLDLLLGLQDVASVDWSLILRNVLSSATPINPVATDTVETVGYLNQFRWVLEKELDWSHIQGEVRYWLEEIEREEVERTIDEERTEKIRFPRFRVGPFRNFTPDMLLVTADDWREGVPTWATIGEHSYYIFRDGPYRSRNNLVSMNLLTGETRVIREQRGEILSRIETFEYRGRVFAIYGATSRGESGVEVVDLVTGRRAQFWRGLRVESRPLKVGTSLDGKPRFLVRPQNLWANEQMKGTYIDLKRVVELTFQEKGIKTLNIKHSPEEGEWNLHRIYQYLSNESGEYLLVETDQKDYRVLSYPNLDEAGKYSRDGSSDLARWAFSLNVPTLYSNVGGEVRLILGVPRKEAGGMKFLADYPLSDIRIASRDFLLGRVYQPPFRFHFGRSLTALVEEDGLGTGGRLYLMGLDDRKILSRIHLDDEFHTKFGVRFVEIYGELYLFFATKADSDKMITLHLVHSLETDERYRFELSDFDSTRSSPPVMVSTQEGLLVWFIGQKLGFRSVFLSRD